MLAIRMPEMRLMYPIKYSGEHHYAYLVFFPNMTTSASTAFTRNASNLESVKTLYYFAQVKGSDTNQQARTTLGLFRNLPPFEVAKLTIHRVCFPNFEGTFVDEVNNNMSVQFITNAFTSPIRTLQFTEGQYTPAGLAAAVTNAVHAAAALNPELGNVYQTHFQCVFDASTSRLRFLMTTGPATHQLVVFDSTSADILGLATSREIQSPPAPNVVLVLTGGNSILLPKPVNVRPTHSVTLCSNLLTNVESNNNFMYGPIAQMTLPLYANYMDWENDGNKSPGVLVDYDSFSALTISLLTPAGRVLYLPNNYTFELSIQLELLMEQSHNATLVSI